ncbi:hypothetical protein MNBD_GAMMA11-2846 [hydrothermal vent metagenome]|uniref:ATPase AAA-type core domain-containing protein n=1 Tax=hydrothermal vent metagenome TaxID=652676 RepID=A0A3B0XUJ8_9ZZZZ
MKIRKLYVDGYKNLVNCKIFPSALHAITGINGSGKSNLLEIFQFIAALITRDDTFRDDLLLRGHCPSSGSQWFPIPTDNTTIPPLQFHLECETSANGKPYIVTYSLEIAGASIGEKGSYDLAGRGLISHEKLDIKQTGTPGPMKTVLNRDIDGAVTMHAETGSRKIQTFKTKKNMSAIQALEVREADDFTEKHPVLNQFKTGLTSSVVVKLNPETIARISRYDSNQKTGPRSPGTPLNSFSLFESIQTINDEKVDLGEYKYWLKVLCNIDEIDAISEEMDENTKLGEKKFIFIKREEQFLTPDELSTGNLVLLSLVTALFSLLRTSGIILLEEPETYIHPKAQIDLIRLLRDISEVKTVIFSTHSTVILNSMSYKEVTLMMQSGDGRYTSKAVKEIQEASDAISRGYLSFGDLLQSNFMTE